MRNSISVSHFSLHHHLMYLDAAQWAWWCVRLYFETVTRIAIHTGMPDCWMSIVSFRLASSCWNTMNACVCIVIHGYSSWMVIQYLMWQSFLKILWMPSDPNNKGILTGNETQQGSIDNVLYKWMPSSFLNLSDKKKRCNEKWKKFRMLVDKSLLK